MIARLVARYSQGRNADEVVLEFTNKTGEPRDIHVAPMKPHEIPKTWLI
ncbi:MAG: hypothetical protein ABW160_19200 [Candidatus Thiodiazotropha sp. 4PDIV1]